MRRIHYNSPVVLTFSLLSLLALLLGSVSGGWTNSLLFSVYRAPLTDPLTYARAFLHVLGHSGWAHYSGNILLMLVIGPQLEEPRPELIRSMCSSTKSRCGISQA